MPLAVAGFNLKFCSAAFNFKLKLPLALALVLVPLAVPVGARRRGFPTGTGTGSASGTVKSDSFSALTRSGVVLGGPFCFRKRPHYDDPIVVLLKRNTHKHT